MATTTNYGWTTPDDTDLVKDGAAAIRTLGSSVDTTTKALNPSTTEGDLEYRSSTANTNNRLAIGTAGQVLAVNGTANAPEWVTPASTTPTFTGVSCFKSAAQSVSNSTTVALTFDSENFDTHSYHSTVTNNSRITIPAGKAGYYNIQATVAYQANTTGVRVIYFFKNGDPVGNFALQSAATPSSENISNASYLINLAEGDYMEVYVFQSSGGALNILSGSDLTTFSMTYLGA